MSNSLNQDRAEFAVKRRSQQDDLVERLQGVIGATFSTGDIDPLVAALEAMYVEAYESEIDSLVAALTPRALSAAVNRFIKSVREMLSKADEKSSVAVTSLALANALLNDSTASAYGDSGVEMEWVSMRDEDVRHTHDVADGQRRPLGEKFTVGEAKMRFPGDITAPIEEWINCRCSLRPVVTEASLAAKYFALPQHVRDGIEAKGQALFGEALTAGADVTDDTVCIMALPAAGEMVHGIGEEEKHATLIYFGEVPPGGTGAIDAIMGWTQKVAADAEPFTAEVSEIGELGHDAEKVPVWMLAESDLNGIHEGLMSDDAVRQAYEEADTTKYPEYTPHVTITYEAVPEEASEVKSITFDRLSVWHGSDRTDFTLGEPMPDDIEQPEEVSDQKLEEVEDSRVPWHGVLAPENVRSGDGRQFTNLGRTRDLPLPLTWQELSDDGHNRNISVATIEKVQMIDGLMHGSGFFLSSVEEADEVIGLIAEMGRFGVSVDADDIGSASFDEENDLETYDDPRISSACIVSIPAFAEAWVAIGKHPILDAEEDTPTPEEIPEEVEEQGLAASAIPLLQFAGVPEKFKEAALAQHAAEQEAFEAWADVEQFLDVSPGKTEDGPGWLTHPVDTDRLRDYWVRGPGAAKIGWGIPGDFNRCRINTAEYVKPQHLNGYCANRHYDALGVWPGREVAAAETITARVAEGEKLPGTLVRAAAPTLTLVASAAGWEAPSEFFLEPVDCDPDDGIRITEDGRVYGYVAEWGVCHIGYDGMCKEAPPSMSNYAYFRTGEVNTPDGPVKVGGLTSATGHADGRLKAMPAAAHYDDTGSVWALVAAGENERGIWFSGMVHPKADPDLLNDVVASGRISGDWRPIGHDLELVAGLTVNVGGFPIIQTTAVASNGRQLSLVAAGVPVPKVEEAATIFMPSDPSLLASLVVDEMEARRSRRDRFEAIKNNSKGE